MDLKTIFYEEWKGYKEVYLCISYYDLNTAYFEYIDNNNRTLYGLLERDGDDYKVIKDNIKILKYVNGADAILVYWDDGIYYILNDKKMYPVQDADVIFWVAKGMIFVGLPHDKNNRIVDMYWEVIVTKNGIKLDNLGKTYTPKWEVFFFSKNENGNISFYAYHKKENFAYKSKNKNIVDIFDWIGKLGETIFELDNWKYIYLNTKMETLCDEEFDKAKLFSSNDTALVTIKNNSFLIDKDFKRINDKEDNTKKLSNNPIKIIPPNINTKELGFKPIIDQMKEYVLKTNINPQEWSEDLEGLPEDFLSFHEEVLTSSDDFWYALNNWYVEISFITDKKREDLTKKELDAIKEIVDFYWIEF